MPDIKNFINKITNSSRKAPVPEVNEMMTVLYYCYLNRDRVKVLQAIENRLKAPIKSKFAHLIKSFSILVFLTSVKQPMICEWVVDHKTMLCNFVRRVDADNRYERKTQSKELHVLVMLVTHLLKLTHSREYAAQVYKSVREYFEKLHGSDSRLRMAILGSRNYDKGIERYKKVLQKEKPKEELVRIVKPQKGEKPSATLGKYDKELKKTSTKLRKKIEKHHEKEIKKRIPDKQTAEDVRIEKPRPLKMKKHHIAIVNNHYFFERIHTDGLLELPKMLFWIYEPISGFTIDGEDYSCSF